MNAYMLCTSQTLSDNGNVQQVKKNRDKTLSFSCQLIDTKLVIVLLNPRYITSFKIFSYTESKDIFL